MRFTGWNVDPTRVLLLLATWRGPRTAGKYIITRDFLVAEMSILIMWVRNNLMLLAITPTEFCIMRLSINKTAAIMSICISSTGLYAGNSIDNVIGLNQTFNPSEMMFNSFDGVVFAYKVHATVDQIVKVKMMKTNPVAFEFYKDKPLPTGNWTNTLHVAGYCGRDGIMLFYDGLDETEGYYPTKRPLYRFSWDGSVQVFQYLRRTEIERGTASNGSEVSRQLTATTRLDPYQVLFGSPFDILSRKMFGRDWEKIGEFNGKSLLKSEYADKLQLLRRETSGGSDAYIFKSPSGSEWEFRFAVNSLMPTAIKSTSPEILPDRPQRSTFLVDEFTPEGLPTKISIESYFVTEHGKELLGRTVFEFEVIRKVDKSPFLHPADSLNKLNYESVISNQFP